MARCGLANFVNGLVRIELFSLFEVLIQRNFGQMPSNNSPSLIKFRQRIVGKKLWEDKGKIYLYSMFVCIYSQKLYMFSDHLVKNVEGNRCQVSCTQFNHMN